MYRELLYFLFLDFIYFVSCAPPPVYVSNGTHIVSYSKNGPVEAVHGQRDYRIVGLAVDISRNFLFWSDISADYRGIYKSDLHGNNIVKIINDVGEINGLTVDWVSSHIYWTDMERKTVEVADYDGTSRRVIVSTGLKTPRSIVAAPLFGFLFWADQRNKRIERAWLDGSHRRTLVKSGDYFPNQLAVSNKRQMLYWVDADKHGVFSCNLNGNQVKEQVNYSKISKGAPGFGLVVFGNTALISTWFNTGLYVLLLDSKRLIWHQEAEGLGTRELFSLVSLNPDTQPMTIHACMEENNGGCSHLCLPTNKDKYVCVCPTYGGLTMSADGKTCTVPDEILLCTVEDSGVGFISLGNGYARDVALISKSANPKAVSYDQQQGMVYWSDIGDKAIYRCRLDGSERVVYKDRTSGIGIVNSLYFHRETASLYFTNTVTNGYSSLERIDTHTGSRKTLIRNLQKPINFVVDEENRYIYLMTMGFNDIPSISRTELDGNNAFTLPIDITDPVGFVVNGNKLSVAEAFTDDTILTEIDLNTLTTVSTQFAEKAIDGITSRGQDKFLIDNTAREVVYLNNSKPIVILQDVQLADILYTKTTSQIVADDLDMCLEYSCSCIPLPQFSNEGASRCMCQDSLLELPAKDGRSCKRPENFMLFSERNTINMVSLDSDTVDTPVVLYYGDSNSTFTSLIVDDVKSRLYWIDTSRDSIYMSHMHALEPVLVYRDEGPINSLVLDSIKQRLYWTLVLDHMYFIASLNLEKGLLSYKRVLKTPNKLLSLAIHPNERWLFFAEKDTDGAAISSCKTNGNRYRKLVTSGLVSPVSVVATKDKLYVAESTGGIIVYHVEDDKIEDVYPVADKISGLAVHGNLLVYSGYDYVSVFDTMTRRHAGVLASDLNSPGSVVVHHPSDRNVCPTNFNEPCSDICGPLFKGEYFCGCAAFTQRHLDSDDRSCIDASTTTSTSATTVAVAAATTTTTTITPTTEVTSKIPDNDKDEELVRLIDKSFNQKPTTTTSATTFAAATTTTTPEPTTTSTTLENLVDLITTTPSYTEYLNENGIDSTDDSTDDDTEMMVSTESVDAASIGHTGEPKPTLSTKTYEDDGETLQETTVDYTERYGFIHSQDIGGVGIEPIDKPYFENCPENDTVLVTVPDNARRTEIPIRPIGYTSSGSQLPLHCNYEMTEGGIIVAWQGDGPDSRHDVVFSVTNSLRQTSTCIFRVILQDVDKPKFTHCPPTNKVRTVKEKEFVHWLVPEAKDNVGVKHVTSSHNPGNQFEPGVTVVNYTAIDFAGNQAQCLFKVFVVHDKLCNVADIPHGGIVCDNGGDGDCRVICESGYVVNPIRVFRRMFNCNHPDDADAINRAMSNQSPCLKHEYPSVFQQEFRMTFRGPISKHKTEVKTNLTLAISNHLDERRLCTGEMCHVGDVSMKCSSVPADDVIFGGNVSCIDIETTTEFFVDFNITLRNNTNNNGDDEVDVITISERIHADLREFTNMLQLQFDEHVYTPVANSLVRAIQPEWSCPLGQISEDNICISCPPGTFHNMTLNVCQYCSMGYYQENQGQVTCHVCEPRRTSPDGATSADQCHTLPSMDEMTLFIIVTTCSFGVVFLCMAITLYLQFQRQHKRNQQASSLKKTRYNMTPNLYVAPPPILKSKLDENFSPGEKTYSIDRKHPINIFANHDYDDHSHSRSGGSLYHNDVFTMLHGQGQISRDYSPGEEVPTGTLSRDNTFSNPTYSPQFGIRRAGGGSLQRSIHTPSPGPQRKMSHDSTFSNQSPRMMSAQRTPTSDTPLITQSPLLRMKLAAYNLNHED